MNNCCCQQSPISEDEEGVDVSILADRILAGKTALSECNLSTEKEREVIERMGFVIWRDGIKTILRYRSCSLSAKEVAPPAKEVAKVMRRYRETGNLMSIVDSWK